MTAKSITEFRDRLSSKILTKGDPLSAYSSRVNTLHSTSSFKDDGMVARLFKVCNYSFTALLSEPAKAESPFPIYQVPVNYNDQTGVARIGSFDPYVFLGVYGLALARCIVHGHLSSGKIPSPEESNKTELDDYLVTNLLQSILPGRSASLEAITSQINYTLYNELGYCLTPNVREMLERLSEGEGTTDRDFRFVIASVCGSTDLTSALSTIWGDKRIDPIYSDRFMRHYLSSLSALCSSGGFVNDDIRKAASEVKSVSFMTFSEFLSAMPVPGTPHLQPLLGEIPELPGYFLQGRVTSARFFSTVRNTFVLPSKMYQHITMDGSDYSSIIKSFEGKEYPGIDSLRAQFSEALAALKLAKSKTKK